MRTNSPVVTWSRSDLRRRLVSLITLGVLAGLTMGLAVAAFDGARRTGTALGRLRDRTNASDAVVFASQSGNLEPDWTKLATEPEVNTIARWGLALGNLEGDPDGVLFAPIDGTWLGDVDRPIVVSGRMFDPEAPDEAVLSDDATDLNGVELHVGQTVHFVAMAADQSFEEPARGPVVDFKIVGIVHTPLSYVFTGGAFISPGYAATYGAKAVVLENLLVQLHHGADDVAALRAHASADVTPGIPVLDFHVTGRRVTATTDVEDAMLKLLSVIVALAGLVFVGQAVARSASTIGTDEPTLGALGMDRGQLVEAALLPHLLTAAVAAIVTLGTAAIASRWFPVGLAAHVDPDRGLQINAALFAAAALLVAALVIAGAAFTSWRIVRPADGLGAQRPSWLIRAGLLRPVTAGIGARMALDSGTRSGRAASRPALIGAAAAVAGLVAIITLNHGLTDSLAHPDVAGVAWDATVRPAPEDQLATGLSPAVLVAVRSQPGIAAYGTIGRTVVDVNGVGVPTYTAIGDGDAPHIDLVTLSGRAPETNDEIGLGPSTARDLGVGVGDTVNLAGVGPMKVVGLGLFPSDVHAQFDEGAWVSPDPWFRVTTTDGSLTEGEELFVAVRFAKRAHIDDQVNVLGASLEASGAFVEPVDVPTEFANLHNVRSLPTVLAGFLGLLGVLTVGHALFSSVRRRSRDFAVLGALGITRWGSRAILAAHGSVVAIAGLVVGIPLGLLAGRAGWRAIADRVPIVFHSPLTATAVVLVIPIVILGANALAILPGRRAARLQPALILRSE